MNPISENYFKSSLDNFQKSLLSRNIYVKCLEKSSSYTYTVIVIGILMYL